MSAPLRLSHYVSLSGFGGVEQHFARFLAETADWPDIEQHILVCSRRIHAHHRITLTHAASARPEKHRLGMRVPSSLRRHHYRRLARRINADVALLWNRMGQQRRVLEAVGAERCMSCWHFGYLPLQIHWSRASARMQRHEFSRIDGAQNALIPQPGGAAPFACGPMLCFRSSLERRLRWLRWPTATV